MNISPASLTRSKLGAECNMILVGDRIKGVWFPKVGRHLVKLPDGPEHYGTKDEALAAAAKFRDLCRAAKA